MEPTSITLAIGSLNRAGAGGGGGGGAGGGAVGVGGGAGLPPDEPPQPLNKMLVAKLATSHRNQYRTFTFQRSMGLGTRSL